MTGEDFNLFGFDYDVSAAKALRAGRPFDGWFNVSDAEPYIGFVMINARHARTVDIRQPIIVVERTFGAARVVYRVPIDGWHRVFYARKNRIPRVPMFLMTGDEEKSIRR